MGNGLGIVAAKEADFMIHSLLKFELFGQELYLRRRMSVYCSYVWD